MASSSSAAVSSSSSKRLSNVGLVLAVCAITALVVKLATDDNRVPGNAVPLRRQPKEGPQTVLVVGAAEPVGAAVARALHRREDVVVGIDPLGYPVAFDEPAATIPWDEHAQRLRLQRAQGLQRDGIELVRGDICDADFLASSLGQREWSHVVLVAGTHEDLLDEHADAVADSSLSCLVVLLETLVKHKATPSSDLPLVVYAAPNMAHALPVPKDVSCAVTDEQPTTVAGALHRAAELLLQTYNHMYKLPSTVLRLSNVYGPQSEAFPGNVLEAVLGDTLLRDDGSDTAKIKDQDTTVVDLLFVDDAANAALAAISFGCTQCCFAIGSGSMLSRHDVVDLVVALRRGETLPPVAAEAGPTAPALPGFEAGVQLAEGLGQLEKWAQELAVERSASPQPWSEVVFASYFTTAVDPQRQNKRIPNRFSYIKAWYESVINQGMYAVIFHDGLTNEFQDKLSSDHVRFHHVDSLDSRSTNDARFYLYRDYLLSHPEIERVFLTDISDVRFQRNPFEFVHDLGDLVYVGQDVTLFDSMQDMGWMQKRVDMCFQNTFFDKEQLAVIQQLKYVFNAGVIGGQRHTMLDVLDRIVQHLDYTPHEANCNMAVVNLVLHKFFQGRVFTGFPLTSRFLMRQAEPRGVYIVHK